MTRLYKLYYGMFLLIVSILPDMSHILVLGPVAQLEASSIADSGVASSIPAWSHTFVVINHEIFSDDSRRICCQLHVKVCAQSTG